MLPGMQANFYAASAIGLWATLAALGVALEHLPPFLLTGIALMVGCLLAVPFEKVFAEHLQLEQTGQSSK